jgi:hypothetical protein
MVTDESSVSSASISSSGDSRIINLGDNNKLNSDTSDNEDNADGNELVEEVKYN